MDCISFGGAGVGRRFFGAVLLFSGVSLPAGATRRSAR